MLHHNIIIIAIILICNNFLVFVHSIQSHTSETLLIQRLTLDINHDSNDNSQYLVDYTFSGYELYPWSQHSIYDRNTFSHSTDILPKDILKLMNLSGCTHMMITIGDGNWNYDKFFNPPIEIVPNGSTLLANIPRNHIDHDWSLLTHGLWGLTGVSFNMSKSPIIIFDKPLSGKNKETFDDLKLLLKQIGSWYHDTVQDNYYYDYRDNPKEFNNLEIMQDLIYKIDRNERAICYDNLPEENLCTDNLSLLERLLPCGYRKGYPILFNDLSNVISSEYKGIKLSSSLYNGRYYYSLNLHYVTNGIELDRLKLLQDDSNRCFSVDKSQIFIRSSQIGDVGSNIGDGSYIYTPKPMDFKSILTLSKPLYERGIRLKFEELSSFEVNRRINSTLLITISNSSDVLTKIGSITSLPHWLVPLGHTLIISNDNGIICKAEECFNGDIDINWTINNELSEDTRSRIRIVTEVYGNSNLYISFQVLKNLLCYYSMGFGELRGQILPGTFLLYQNDINIWPESYRNYLSRISLLQSIGVDGVDIDMTRQEVVDFKSLSDEIFNMMGFDTKTKYLVSNPLMLKILIADNTISYNAMVLVGVVLGALFTMIYKTTIEIN